MRPIKYWCVVASKDHVERGVRDGFVQANHGRESPLKRMQAGDFVVTYSSKLTSGEPEKCQKFTAIGRVGDDEIFQIKITEEFCPFRRRVEYIATVEAPIQPLIDELRFIPNKKSWGYPFRFGFFEINEHDFDLISSNMLNGTQAR